MKRGDIYLVDLDPTVGHEQSGVRPVLVISPDDFNRATRLPVVVPITRGGDFAVRIGFAVPLVGLRTTGLVRCDQPRVVDMNGRRGRKIEAVGAALLDEVLAKVAAIFE